MKVTFIFKCHTMSYKSIDNRVFQGFLECLTLIVFLNRMYIVKVIVNIDKSKRVHAPT